MSSERATNAGLDNGSIEWWLSLAVRFLAVLLVLALVGLAAFYIRQRYFHPTVSVVDRDIQTIQAQIRAQPGDPELRVALGNLYLEKQRYDEAIVQVEPVIKQEPGHIGAALTLAQAYAAKKQPEQAIGYLEVAVEENRDNPMAKASLQLATAYHYLGSLYLDEGRTEKAIAELRQALESDKANADTLYLLGKAIYATGQRDEAIEMCLQALRFVPDFPEVYGLLYQIYQDEGDRDKALFASGMVEYGKGKYDRAIEALQQAAQASPDMAEAHLGLGMALEKKGRSAEALDQYRLALEKDSTSIAARQDVARLEGGQ